MEVNYFELLNLGIEVLNFRSHIYAVLKKHLIHKIGDLVSLNLTDILEFEGINEYWSNEIFKKVHNFGLYFSDEIIKPKNKVNIMMGLKTYNLRKKFSILNALGKNVESLKTSIEILDLLPFEYEFLKNSNINTIGDLIKNPKDSICNYFNRQYKYDCSNISNIQPQVLVLYNKIINQVHSLGLCFIDEKDIYNLDNGYRIFNAEFFK